MILLGIVLTIFSRSRLFLPVSVVGMIFLCGLFFHCFMVAYKRDEKVLFRRRARATTLDGDPEQLLFFGHSPWIFDRPWLFLAGVLFVFLGIGLVVITRDVYLLLLSVFGIVFMLQVWSFWQLNSLTVTTERAIFQQASQFSFDDASRHPRIIAIEDIHPPTPAFQYPFLLRQHHRDNRHTGLMCLPDDTLIYS